MPPRAARGGNHGDLAPHGTTIVAATFDGGVVMAGDRRATMGNVIAQRDIQKVFPADEFSCIGIAGSAGLAIELVRLFQVELEHYEKIEGMVLSADGKANRLAALIRGNLGTGHAGPRSRTAVRQLRPRDRAGPHLLVRRHRRPLRRARVPLRRLRLGVRQRSAQEALQRPDLTEADCVTAVIQALYDAADDDSATGGPDLTRRIFPVVARRHR